MSTFIFLQSGLDQVIGMLPLLLIFVVFWFFILRPQMKKQKEQAKFGTHLAKGLDVVTSSGIIGKINKIDGEIVQLEVDTKTYIRVTKSAISKELTESMFGGSKATTPIETKD